MAILVESLLEGRVRYIQSQLITLYVFWVADILIWQTVTIVILLKKPHYRKFLCQLLSMRTLGDGLRITARAGKIAEGFEHESLPVWGVQWHPERMNQNNPCRKYSSKLIMELISKGKAI